MQKMEDEGIETVEAQPEFAKQWAKEIQDINAMTLIDQTDSWWMGSNIPGKVREQLNYFKGLDVYVPAINDTLAGWKGFDVVKRSPADG